MNRRGFLGALCAVPVAVALPNTLPVTESTLREALHVPPLEFGWHEYGCAFEVNETLLRDDQMFRRYADYLRFAMEQHVGDRRILNGRVLFRLDAK